MARIRGSATVLSSADDSVATCDSGTSLSIWFSSARTGRVSAAGVGVGAHHQPHGVIRRLLRVRLVHHRHLALVQAQVLHVVHHADDDARPGTADHLLALARNAAVVGDALADHVGVRPASTCCAIDSLTITTSWPSLTSCASKSRPLIIGMPMARKYPGVIDRTCGDWP